MVIELIGLIFTLDKLEILVLALTSLIIERSWKELHQYLKIGLNCASLIIKLRLIFRVSAFLQTHYIYNDFETYNHAIS